MKLDNITSEELDFMSCFYNSLALAECLFSNAENLSIFNEEEFIEIRLGQIPLLSGEYIIDSNIKENTARENFALREGAGSLFCFGGRLFGKTFIGEKIDLLEYILCSENESCGFSSFDQRHIEGVLKPVLQALEQHPILKLFIEGIKRSPYYVTTRLGTVIESINMNLADGQKAGTAYFQKHLKKLFIEEASRESQTVYENRAESRSEVGCVMRILGMANFTHHDPAGKQFFENEHPSRVLNLPAYVNPNYDLVEEERAIKKYGGKQSIGFKVFVDGEVIADGISSIDMERVSQLCYPRKANGEIDYSITIKSFEIDKKNYNLFRAVLVVERPKNCDRLIIAADIGRLSGTTEIIVLAENKNRWKYTYNITLRNVTKNEQLEIFKYLYTRLKPNYMGLDSTDGSGDAIVSDLAITPGIDKNKIMRVCFNTNIEIGIETDEAGKPIRENGKTIKKFAPVSVWSVQRLTYLLYEALLYLPIDYKLDEQMTKVIAIPRGTTIIYECAARENHLWQAFQVFAIMQFMIEYEGFSKKSNKPERDMLGV